MIFKLILSFAHIVESIQWFIKCINKKHATVNW
ncbi:MAG: hypothetical protein Edafosvirus31_1, partial [Edafosvirus sp.]